MKTEQEGTCFRDRFTHVTCGTIASLIEIAQVHNWIIFIKNLVNQYIQDTKLIQTLSNEEIVSDICIALAEEFLFNVNSLLEFLYEFQ